MSAVKVGENYVVETIQPIYIGKLVQANPTELVLDQCSWIPETGRKHAFISKGTFEECEPLGDGVIVPRAVVQGIMPWRHELPTKPKPA